MGREDWNKASFIKKSGKNVNDHQDYHHAHSPVVDAAVVAVVCETVVVTVVSDVLGNSSAVPTLSPQAVNVHIDVNKNANNILFIILLNKSYFFKSLSIITCRQSFSSLSSRGVSSIAVSLFLFKQYPMM